MTQFKPKPSKAEAIVREIKRAMPRKFSADEKIRIVLEGLHGETPIADLCRREGIQTNMYYRWLKDFLEAGRKRLQGDITHEATSSEVGDRIVKRLAKRAGIAKSISAHSCRHSTASLAIAAGAQPHKVQAHLRHRSITTTMQFVHDREALESNASDFIRI